MNMNAHPRYGGKPLLRLLELYVLWAIGELSAKDAALLEGMTPRLQKLYQIDGPWYEVIAGTMHMPADMPKALMALWKKNLEIARQHGAVLTPQEFAEMAVDENFAS